MAYRNQCIRNAQTGHEITFLHPAKHTEGRFLGLLITFNPQQWSPIPYCHPQQSVDFDVVKGELTVQLDGNVSTLQPGDTIQIPSGHVYRCWNDSKEPSSINCRIRPALDTEQLLETLTTLVNTNPMPRSHWTEWLQYTLVARKFAHVFRRADLPVAVQQLMFILLTPLIGLGNYRSVVTDGMPIFSKRLSQSKTVKV